MAIYRLVVENLTPEQRERVTKAQKFFADMENLSKNFIPFVLSSEEEQDKSIEVFASGLELEDSMQIFDAYLKIYKKAKDIGLVDQYIKMSKVKSITETTPLPMIN
ncbi:hypothetical protein WR25_23471 [Diploscapter pachys]|uniref:Uncharacterized protein n=1 Tax=Diploscapter pachys TaxID=2018661 RepID=A0A2A2L9M6_9BILA|nr:hypothetical protein WR25_23471 [Diploscapter pachys]